MNDAVLADLLFTLRVAAIAFAAAWGLRRLPAVKLRIPGRRHPVTWAETAGLAVCVAGGLALVGGVGWAAMNWLKI